MAEKTKVHAYLGFAIKSGNLKCGVNSIYTIRKRVYLMIICNTVSENTMKDANKLQRKFACPLAISNTHTVENLVNKENCKLIAITSEELSKAIILEFKEDFTICSGGHKR